MKHTLTILIMLITPAGFSRTIYINPSYHGVTQNGTQQYPYDSWQDFSLSNGNTYLQKCGTTYNSSTQIYVNDHSVTIGSYGTGNRPIFSYTGTSYAIRVNASYCSISDFEINGNGSAYALVGFTGMVGDYGQFNKIDNCLLYNAHNPNNAGFGIYGNYNTMLKILNTEIRNVAVDGIYLAYTPGIEIGHCFIHDVNRRYLLNKDQKYSSGDGIQFDGQYNGFYLHHTTVDRTNGCGNKFGVIFASKVGVSNNATGVIEYCTFRTDGNVTTAVDIEMGRGIITRYNRFEGVTQGLRLGGAYTSNNLIENNIFVNCSAGVGVGYKYPNIGPATGTKVYNNTFTHVTGHHIWVDKSIVETCGNTTDGIGTPEYNYNTGQFNHVGTCKN